VSLSVLTKKGEGHFVSKIKGKKPIYSGISTKGLAIFTAQ
jgi:hypothetical protein